MDVSMPFMGGMEATSLIRKFEDEDGLERIPIIALTAHAMLGDREKCIAAGMVRHPNFLHPRCHKLTVLLIAG